MGKQEGEGGGTGASASPQVLPAGRQRAEALIRPQGA